MWVRLESCQAPYFYKAGRTGACRLRLELHRTAVHNGRPVT